MPNPSRFKPSFLAIKTLKVDNLKPTLQWLRDHYRRFIEKNSAKIIIVPRWQCIYRCFELGNIPANTQRQALQLKINQWSPWPQAMTNIIWQNNQAQVWCWQAGEAVKKTKYLAESRFFSHPDDGLQLLGLEQGYEGQYWRRGLLQESRWWPQMPSDDAWQNFQRAAGVVEQSPLPPAAITQKQTQPWGKEYRLEHNALLLNLEPRLWRTLPLTLVFFSGWQGAQIFLLNQDINNQRQQQQELTQKIEPILKIRNSIQDDQRHLEPIVGLWQGHRQLQLLSQVIAKLPNPTEMKILLWEYQPEQLRFTLQTANTDPSLFVKTYSGLAWGAEVSAQPDSKAGEITITIRLKANASTQAS